MPTFTSDKAQISISNKKTSIYGNNQSASEGRDLPLLFDQGYLFDDGHYFDKGRPGSVVSSDKAKISNVFDKSLVNRSDDRAKISFKRERT